jgi:hypothetical protein
MDRDIPGHRLVRVDVVQVGPLSDVVDSLSPHGSDAGSRMCNVERDIPEGVAASSIIASIEDGPELLLSHEFHVITIGVRAVNVH